MFRMKIGLFVKDFAVGKKFAANGLPNKSGAEFHAENHARQLIGRGNEVSVWAKKRYWFTKARENLDGIDLVRLHGGFRWLEILLRLFLTHRGIDAFYIIGTPKFAVWAILYARFCKRPVTLALTGKAEIFDGRAGWRNKIFASCDNYIATTHEILNGFIRQGNIPPEKVTFLPHGIDTARYPRPGLERKLALRKRHGITDPAVKILLFCARIVVNKGVDTLQKIWPIIHGKDPSAHLFIVGGGRHELLAELREMADAMDGSVTVVGEVDQPQEYYQMSDVYVFPSRHEGLPTSLIEAMSSGLPAVVSDIGGCDDLIFDHETGFRVNTEDAEAFADRILYLFRHDEECREMSDRAASYVQERCDYSQVIWRLEEIIGGAGRHVGENGRGTDGHEQSAD